MERKETLGEFLKRWRYCKGWTQKQTAQELHICTCYYNQIESSRKDAKRKYHSARMMHKLSAMTGATVSFLMALPTQKEDATQKEKEETTGNEDNKQ